MINYITDQGGERFPNAPRYFTPPQIPDNVIRYKAPAKLTQTTSTKSYGVKIKMAYSSQNISPQMISHTFEDGVGTITYAAPIKIIGPMFSECTDVTEIEFPATVERFITEMPQGIYKDCFSGTRVLNCIKIHAVKPPILNTFQNYASSCYVNIPSSINAIYVPKQSVNAYKNSIMYLTEDEEQYIESNPQMASYLKSGHLSWKEHADKIYPM